MYDIVELQHKLSEARDLDTDSSRIKARLASSTSKYRSRTAAIDHHHDASELLELGVDLVTARKKPSNKVTRGPG
jgi:hypothetical protein